MRGYTIRRMTLDRVRYPKGKRVDLPADQFATLEALGFVRRPRKKSLSGDNPARP